MNLRRVGLVLRKEVREALRDRRTLFVTLVLPILLYPALMIGLGTLSVRQQGKLREQSQAYALAGPVPAALRAELAAVAGLRLAEPADPEKALRGGELHLLVRAAADFERVLAEGGSARLELLHDSASEPSAEARRKAMAAVEAFRGAVLKERLASKGLAGAFVKPVDVPAAAITDVATATRRGAHSFGRMLSFMLVVMVVSGAFTPAVDAVAGEKERGTMETLLVCPATRVEVVLGKFLSIFAVSVATALGNLLSMGATFGQLASSLGVSGRIDFTVSVGTAATIFAVLLPLAAVFSALALALSTLARSTKEAQTYLTPLMLVAMPLCMVSIVPNIELTLGLASVPVSGAVLLFRDLMLAQGEPALLAKVLPMVPVVLGTTVLAAGLALRWAVWMFEREEVLFRDAGQAFSWKDLRPVRRAGALPGPGAAFFLPTAVLAGTFFVARVVLTPGSLTSPLALVLQQGVMLAAVLAAVALAGLDFRATLGLRRAGLLPIIGAVLLGLGTALAIPWLTRVTGIVPDAEGDQAKWITDLVKGLPLVSLVLMMGVLPGVAEEALFRGWCLRGLRTQMSAVAAVVISSVLFGAFHLEPARMLVTGAMGLAFGFVALRTGSIWPGVLAHALHNGLTTGLSKAFLEGDGTQEIPAAVLSGSSDAFGLAGVAAVAAGLLLVRAATAARDSLPAATPAR